MATGWTRMREKCARAPVSPLVLLSERLRATDSVYQVSLVSLVYLVSQRNQINHINEKDLCYRSFRIWLCSSLKSFGGMASDFLTSLTAETGHGAAHTPQPMHHSLSMTGKSPSILITWTGQMSTQSPHPVHFSLSVSRRK